MRATDKQRGFYITGNYGGDRHYRRTCQPGGSPTQWAIKKRRISKKPSAILWRWKTPLICTNSTITIQPQIRGLNLVEAPTPPPLSQTITGRLYQASACRSRGNDYVLVNPGEHGAYDLLSAGPMVKWNRGRHHQLGFEQEEKVSQR